MREHHVTGSLTCTRSSTPSLTSRSRPAFTSAAQWIGTDAGEWTATGCAALSTNNRNGGLSCISGNGWCSQVLNALAAKRSKIYCFSCGRFSLVGAQGSTGVVVGGVCLTGHEQGWSEGPATPVLVQGGSVAVAAAALVGGVGVSQLPMLGKEVGMTPRSAQVSRDKNG